MLLLECASEFGLCVYVRLKERERERERERRREGERARESVRVCVFAPTNFFVCT